MNEIPIDELGRPHGVRRKYHNNGALCTETPYQHGLFHGHYRVWDEMGRIIADTPYQNNQLHGTTKYFINGFIASSCEWQHNKQHGWSIRYTEDGEVYKKKYYH